MVHGGLRSQDFISQEFKGINRHSERPKGSVAEQFPWTDPEIHRGRAKVGDRSMLWPCCRRTLENEPFQYGHRTARVQAERVVCSQRQTAAARRRTKAPTSNWMAAWCPTTVTASLTWQRDCDELDSVQMFSYLLGMRCAGPKQIYTVTEASFSTKCGTFLLRKIEINNNHRAKIRDRNFTKISHKKNLQKSHTSQ